MRGSSGASPVSGNVNHCPPIARSPQGVEDALKRIQIDLIEKEPEILEKILGKPLEGQNLFGIHFRTPFGESSDKLCTVAE